MRASRWLQGVEVAGTLAVVATLIVLIVEVRTNTTAVERQAALEREARIYNPYLTVPDLAEIYAKIKAHDNAVEPQVRAFAEKYNLSLPEAVRWVRHLDLIWTGLEADYRYYGSTAPLDRQMRALLKYPDERLYWESWPANNSTPFSDRVRAVLRETPP